MIQRIQTLYLAICFVVSGVLPFFVLVGITLTVKIGSLRRGALADCGG